MIDPRSRKNVTDDAFLGGRLRLLQSLTGLRAGIDAVLLAGAVPVSTSEPSRVLDVGTGSGVVGLSILTRGRSCNLTGLDISAELIDLARQNEARNALSKQAEFHVADVRAISETMNACNLAENSFDHVVANPPYFDAGTVQQAPAPIKDRANVMAAGDLDLWIRFMTHTARAKGTLTLVHTVAMLPRLLAALEGRFGGLKVFPLFPRAGQPATRVILQGQKGSRSAMTLLPGLVLHDADGGFTALAERVLRHGAALPLGPQV